MKKGYCFVCYLSILDPKALENYGVLAVPAIKAAGGRVLSRGKAVAAHEAGRLERAVIVEFDTV